MKQRSNPLVYSTDPEENARLQSGEIEKTPSSKAAKQTAIVSLSRKGRGGKSVTLVTGLRHCPEALETLAKRLKQVCGGGGSAKAGEILIQGDHRDKVAVELQAQGYNVKRSGG
jgi:translation initiation factor 1